MNEAFALGTFSADGASFVGLAIDENIVDLAAIPGAEALAGRSMMSLLEDWDASIERLFEAAAIVREQQIPGTAMTDLRVHPPVDLPRQIFCVGANYRKHVVDLTLDMNVGPEGLEGDELRRWAEDMMDRRAATGEPYVFLKLPSAVTGAYNPIVVPPQTEKCDWELELGVVIGKAARNVSRDNALDYVAGFTIVNDVTSRDLIPRRDYPQIGTDWLASKSSPTYLPMGPLLVPKAFVTDPQNLKLTLKLNGKVMQDETTADMIFGIARQIEYISRTAQLWPGDIIATGSPAGNGTHYNRFLQPGDVVDATIEGLGAQRNECVA